MAELTGKTIGDYQVGALIDQAGGGLVYQGVQASSNRPVAIKTLNPDTAGDYQHPDISQFNIVPARYP